MSKATRRFIINKLGELVISLLIVTIWKETITYFKNIKINKDIKIIKQQERLQNMLSFIHQNYYKSISLQDIAEIGNMSNVNDMTGDVPVVGKVILLMYYGIISNINRKEQKL